MWKTVSARLRGAEAELKAMGEDTEGLVETTSKLRGLVKGMTGFDIMEDEDTYKSIYDIVVGIGEKWGELTDIQQASLLESLAGKLQSNRLAAALQNVDQIKEIYKTAEDSAGSAMKEQEHYAESVQYSLDSFKASAESLASTFLDSDFLKGFVDTGSRALDIIEKILDALGSFPTVAAMSGLALDKVLDISILDRAKGKYGEDIGIQNNLSLDNIKDFFVQNFTAQPIFNDEEITALQNYANLISQGMEETQAFDETLKDARPTVQDFARSTDDLSGALGNIPKQNKAITFLKSLGTSLLNMGLITLASVGISALIGWLDELVVTSKEASQSIDSLSSAVETMASTHTSNIQTINSVKDRYYELSEGVNELGKNVSLTSEEYDEYKSIVSQISETMPNLTARYNEQGEKVGFLTGQIKDLDKELAEQEQREASALLADEDFAKNLKDTEKYVNSRVNGANLFEQIGDKNLLDGARATFSALSILINGGLGNPKAWQELDNLIKGSAGVSDKIERTNKQIEDTEKKLKELENTPKTGDFTIDDSVTATIERYKEQLGELRNELVQYQAEQDKSAEGIKSSVRAYTTASKEYSQLDEEQKQRVNDLINNMSTEGANAIVEGQENATVAMQEYAQSLTDAFANNTKGINELTKQLFTLDTEDMSDYEIQEKVTALINRIAEILGISGNELKIRWGFEYVDDNVEDINAVARRMSQTSDNPNSVNESDLSTLQQWIDSNKVALDELEAMEKQGYKTRDGLDALDKGLKKVRKDAKELDGSDITIDTHIKTLDTAKTDLATLETSYKDYKDGNGTVDVNSLNSISDSMKEINGSTEAYQEFLDVLTHMPEDTEAVQKAYNKLVTEYINGTGVLDNLTVANVEYTASELEKMGVVNATEVAYSGLGYTVETTEDQVALLQLGLDNCTDATTRAEFASVDLAKATNSEILSLAQATGTSNGLKFSLYQLAAQKMGVNAISLMTSGDISNLVDLMKQAGLATAELERLARAKAAIGTNTSGKTSFGKGKNKTTYYLPTSDADKANKIDYEAAQEEASNYVPSVYANSGTSTNGGGGGGGSSKNTSPKKTKTKKTKTKKSMSLTKTLYNWIERKLDVLAKKADRAQERIDRLLDWDKKRNATLDALEVVNKQLDANYKASKRYYDYAKSAAKAEAKAAVKQVKSEGSKAQKKKYGKNLSQKTMDKYINLIEQGLIGEEDIQAIKDPRIKAFVDTYIEWYEKAKAVDDELNSLTDTTKDLYDQLANNPLDKCAEQVERLSSEFEILQTKGTNAIVKLNYSFVNLGKVASGVIESVKGLGGYITSESFDTINKNANDQIKLLEKIFKQYEEAYANAQYNFDIASGQYDRARASAVNLFANKDYKDLGVSEDVYNSMKSAIENNELIASDMITQFKASEQTILRTYLDAYQQRESTDTAVKKAEIDYEKNRQDSIAQERDINLERFNAIKSLWDREMSDLNAQKEVLASQVALMEAYGRVYDRKNYDEQYDIEMDNIKLLKQQREQLTAYLAILPEGSSQWWEAKDAINAVNSGITEAINNAYELKQQANAISDNLYDMYETLHNRINNELSFYEQLMEGYEDFDPVKHIATDQGLSRLFLYASQLSEAQTMAEKNAEIVKEYQKALDEANASGAERINATIMGSKVDKTITEAEQSLDDYYDKWRENILATKEMENNLIEWEISKLEEELSLAQEIVDARKDALNAEKNLHDYQRSIQDSTQNINNLQKQITVLKGDTSQEGKARVQALQKQLKDAQKSLEETEYEKYISAEQEMLDNLMEEYTTLIDEEKTHRDELLERAKLDIIANADKIGDTLNTTIEETGYKPQYTQDILDWLKSEQVQQFSNEIKDKLDAISQATKDGLEGLSGDFSRYSGNLSNLLGTSEQEKKEYQEKLKEVYESLNTTMGQVHDKSFAVDVVAPKITNETIVDFADGRVVISHNQTVDVKANADDPTNAGGTGSGGGNGSSGSGSSGGGNGQIFTDSSKTPEKEQQNNTTGANDVPKPDYSPTGVQDIVSQMQADDNEKESQKKSEIENFIKSNLQGITKFPWNDGTNKGYGDLNRAILGHFHGVLSTDALVKLGQMLGVSQFKGWTNKGNGGIYDMLLKYFPQLDRWMRDFDYGYITADSLRDMMSVATEATKGKGSSYYFTQFEEPKNSFNKEVWNKTGAIFSTPALDTIYHLLGLKDRTKILGAVKSSQSDVITALLEITGMKKFAKGGIVDYVHSQGEDGIAMVRQGEGILTPAQTKTFMYDLAPRMDDIIDASKLIKDTTSNLDKIVPMGETNVEATFQFDLENVTNAGDIIKQIQTNNNVQKAIQSVTIDRIAGGSRLGVNKF